MIALLCAGGACYQAALFLRESRRAVAAFETVPAVAFHEIRATREAAVAEIRATRAELSSKVDAVRGDVRQTAGAVTMLVDEHATRIEDMTQAEVRLTRTALVNEIMPVTHGATDLLAEYKAVPGRVAWATSQVWDCEGNPDCFENRWVSVSRAVERSARAVEVSLPQMAVSGERSAERTAVAMDETARFMRNMAEISKPLPRWLRVPLQVAGPTFPIWGPFVWRR